jgi:prolyl oligopeptidase
VVSIDLAHADPGLWKDVIPETENALESAALAGGQLAAHYLVDARSRVQLFSLDGKPLGELALPGLGTIEGMTSRNDTPELFYAFASTLLPQQIIRRDLATGTEKPFFVPKTAFSGSDFETRQLFYPSKDGTRIPLFVSAKKGVLGNGPRPTILYAYGGFNVSSTPWFDPMIAAWLELGGVYAMANIRGGAEYGEAWHKAGMREKKQNVFDDFIAAAEFLSRERISSADKLAIRGASNGGLLVGAVMTQRPELFAVALPQVGVLDMLRFQKFSAGSWWTAEYGTSEVEADFRFLKAYSPLHNVKPGTCYPATLVITADHDDRVVPAHSFKFAATLQAAQTCPHPVLIRVETQGSHGYRPTDKLIAQATDILAFVAQHLGLFAKQ